MHPHQNYLLTSLPILASIVLTQPASADTLKLYLDDMRIEKVEAENTRGFSLRRDAHKVLGRI